MINFLFSWSLFFYREEKSNESTEASELAAATSTEEPASQPAAANEGAEEEVDIDLDDPEVQKAAEKIQATFKGFKTRKTLSEKKLPEEVQVRWNNLWAQFYEPYKQKNFLSTDKYC